MQVNFDLSLNMIDGEAILTDDDRGVGCPH